MLARLLTSTLMLALVAGYTSPAFADDNKTPGHTYAIIVGVGEFKDEQLKPRKTAVADAQALYDLMLNKEYVGSPPTDLHLLISGADEKRMAKEGTKANILAAIADVAKKADKNDTLLLFMIGQGASAGDKTCYFATDIYNASF